MVFVFPGFILTLKVLVRVISSLMVMVNFSFTFVMVLWIIGERLCNGFADPDNIYILSLLPEAV